jgi:hypothetical protein
VPFRTNGFGLTLRMEAAGIDPRKISNDYVAGVASVRE